MKKKYFFLLSFTILYTNTFFSLDLNLFLIPEFSVRNSKTKESLYFSSNPDLSKKCSLLEWNEKKVIKIGFKSEIEFHTENSGIFGILNSISISFPYNKGNMTDSDWNTDGLKFNYSIFDANITYSDFSDIFKNIDTSMNIFYRKKINDFFAIKPYAKFTYSSTFFNGKNGYGWYGSSNWTSDQKDHSWSDDEAHYFPDGKYKLANIDYQSQCMAIFQGISIYFSLSKYMNIFIGTDISPYTFVIASDRHHPNKYETKDYINIIFGNYNFYTGFDIKLSEKILLDFTITFFNIKHTKGDEYKIYDKTDKKELINQKAGYSYSGMSCSASFKFLIF